MAVVTGCATRLETGLAAIVELTAAEAAAADRVEALASAHDGCPCGSAGAGRTTLRAGRVLAQLAAAVEDLAGSDDRLASVTTDLDVAIETAGVDDADAARAALLRPPTWLALRRRGHRPRRGHRRGARA